MRDELREFDELASEFLELVGTAPPEGAQCWQLFAELCRREPDISEILHALMPRSYIFDSFDGPRDVREAQKDVNHALDTLYEIDDMVRPGRRHLAAHLRVLDQCLNQQHAPDSDSPDDALRAELSKAESDTKLILQLMKHWQHLGVTAIPADVNSGLDDPTVARDVVSRALRALDDLDDLIHGEATVAHQGPLMSMTQLHPWVWDAARTLWDSGHHRHAVQAAATAINRHAQVKLGRSDVADDKLMQEAFSPNPPDQHKPRLRCPGDPTNPTVQSCQRGALHYALGCFFAIRNPATHEHGEWDQQIAFEHLAAFSALARWVDDWTVERHVPPS